MDLKQIEGTWEIKVDTEKGWKGTIRISVTLDSRNDGFGNIIFSRDLKSPNLNENSDGVPAGGIDFAGVKRGDKLLLLVVQGGKVRPPFKVKPPVEGLSSVPFALADDKLTLDVSKCQNLANYFLSNSDKLVLSKVKK